jgi:hypothetical protein
MCPLAINPHNLDGDSHDPPTEDSSDSGHGGEQAVIREDISTNAAPSSNGTGSVVDRIQARSTTNGSSPSNNH